MGDKKLTHFGFGTVPETKKASLVHDVFSNVASNYDLRLEWESSFNNVQAATVPGGHFLPEESPDELLSLVIPFFKPSAELS